MTTVYTDCEKANCQQATCEAICPSGALKLTVERAPWAAAIDANRCFSCGLCVQLEKSEHPYRCFGLKINSEHLNKVISWIEDKVPLAIVVGPGLHYYKDNVKLEQLYAIWIHEFGAKIVVLAVNYADKARHKIVAEAITRLTSEAFVIDSRCASVRNLIETQFVDLAPHLITANSTGLTAAADARRQMDALPNAADRITPYRVVFLGPCVAFKQLVDRHEDKEIDAAITWLEFDTICKLNGIELNRYRVTGDIAYSIPNIHNVPEMPKAGDITTLLAQYNIPIVNLRHVKQNQQYTYFEQLRDHALGSVIKHRGFISAFWYGTCRNGPGVYAQWLDQEMDSAVKNSFAESSTRVKSSRPRLIRKQIFEAAAKAFLDQFGAIIGKIVFTVLLLIIVSIATYCALRVPIDIWNVPKRLTDAIESLYK